MAHIEDRGCTCNASRERDERRHDELVGKEEVAVWKAWIAQRGEAYEHWVGAGTGAAKSAYLSGSWNIFPTL